ncbi:uncharacterized protein EV420DRAFT_1274469 [Desarmillaria tabescens]|uniref:Uncharacterized protein n=1 Tax=Armillaria tabescens TaxID=1929756 RepID=A0AA39MYW1_ARMTA|nr:uncharacterized protein EV420DRAFT_1274469 [Desarmillaria tabescens]KAK0451174.1 hypothetical protein EV420DRAFT_1274469 [Desarmillaria tabescens]
MVFYFRCFLLLSSIVQTRAAQDNDGSSNDSSSRTTWDIIWSCIATIFACTWLAVHPNIPSRYMREKGRLFLSLHRVKHMLLAIICPEAVITWAFRQRLVASVLSKRLSHPLLLFPVTEPRPSDLKLSMTHSFFISMGGFIGKDDRPITPADFFVTDAEIRSDLDISPIMSIPEEELMDKSKGDMLSKSISLLQTTWFVIQYISRMASSLPRTQLETATLAFALLNFCNYILWWHKPLDVQYPLQNKAIEDMGIKWMQSESMNSTNSSFLSGESIVHDEESLVSSAQLTTDMILEDEDPVKRAAEPRSSSLTSSIHNNSHHGGPMPYGTCVPTSTSFESTSTQQISINYIENHISEQTCLILSKILGGQEVNMIYVHNTTLPMLWAGQLSWSQMCYSAYFGGCFGALFGGLHCIGWASSGSFDSSLEQLLWKVSSLSIAIIPIIVALASHFALLKSYIIRRVPWLIPYSVPILAFIYVCARIYILVDMFVSLRSIPSAALEEIDWTRYIPHI